MSSLRRRLILLTALFLAVAVAGWLSLRERAYRDDPANYSLIEPRLYIGGWVAEPPPGTDAVLNLCEQEDSYSCESHRWEPIRDAEPAPDLDWLRRQVAVIDAQRQAGRTVFVHCRNGVSRSGMVVVAYLMSEHDWTRDEALAFARSKRPSVRPNPAFMERLSQWEKELQARKKELSCCRRPLAAGG
jgi:hypothetical protein